MKTLGYTSDSCLTFAVKSACEKNNVSDNNLFESHAVCPIAQISRLLGTQNSCNSGQKFYYCVLQIFLFTEKLQSDKAKQIVCRVSILFTDTDYKFNKTSANLSVSSILRFSFLVITLNPDFSKAEFRSGEFILFKHSLKLDTAFSGFFSFKSN